MKSFFYSTHIRFGNYPTLRTPHFALAWAVLAFSVILCGMPSARAASFVTNSPMSTNRYNHTATLLPNGKVLLAAGAAIGPNNFLTPMTSAELFDPATSLWTSTGTLKNARYLQSATLLLNGKVLVVGGADVNNNAINSAELYDPTTGAWANIATLHTVRYGHTATLLPNGRVLLSAVILTSAKAKAPNTTIPAPANGCQLVRWPPTATPIPPPSCPTARFWLPAA